MADPGSPLLRLAPPRTLPRKKVTRKFPPPPAREPPQHGLVLARGLTEVRRHFDEAVARVPRFATDVPYVRLELAPSTFVTDAELSAIGLVPVYRREDAVLAAYSRDRDLHTFESQLASYSQLKKKLAVLAKIETFTPWTRDDRSSARLKALTIEPDHEYTVDLLLMPAIEEKPNPEAMRAVEAFVAERHGRVLDRAVEPTFAAMRVRLRGQSLDDMLEYRDDVALVDLAPKAHVVVPEALSLELDHVPAVRAPAETSPAICIVDSGILEGHPLLEPAIVAAKSRSFPAALGPPVPTTAPAGHGTQVTGVALYGDVASCAHAKSFQPALRIINARMLDDDNALDPDRMPFLRSVVDHVADECRVFNLSFGLEPHDGFLSVHAAELDALARERSVLFVVSSGNVDRARYRAHPPPNSYPEFLADRPWWVRSPSEALNVLTVGGITPDADPHTLPASCQLAAPKRAPSVLACSGGIKNVVKPELVEVAGNVAYEAVGPGLWHENDPGLRVVTTSPGFASGLLLGFVSGTSFAAPRVAHLAARLVDRYPDASPNLLRALLVQSASFPEGVREWQPAQQLRLCGFGVPDLDRALYCRPHRATLYYEGEIVPDEVKVFEIPVPPDFAGSRGRKSLTVSVAYDPPVSVVHRDRPAGVQLTWGVARGDVPAARVEAAIAAEAEAEESTAPTDRKKRGVFLSGALPRRMQQRGTVQKNVFSWKRGVYGDTYLLAVTARATRPAHAETRQGFAVVVTLEHESEGVNVFQLVRARLAAGRVRVRVPATR